MAAERTYLRGERLMWRQKRDIKGGKEDKEAERRYLRVERRMRQQKGDV